MQALLTWLDQLAPLGSVSETMSLLQLELSDAALDQPDVVALLAGAGALILPPEVYLEVAPPARPAPLLATSDVELPEGLVPCPRHEPAYAGLLRQQTDDRTFAKWERLNCLRAMAACAGCGLQLKLIVTLNKDRHWKGAAWPEQVDGRLWFYPGKVAEQTPPDEYLTGNVRPLVLGVRGAPPLQSDYVTCVDIGAPDFVKRAEAAALGLAPRAEVLAKQLRDRGLAGPDAARIPPPEYWVSHDVLAAEQFPGPLPLPGLFFLSLLGQVCSRVTREPGGLYLFETEGARPMKVRCRLTGSGLELDDKPLQIATAELIHFYRECIRAKPQGQNRDLLQQAVLMAGDGKLSSLVTAIGPTHAYYDFQWKTLARARFKEQVDLVKSYLGAVQTARGKVSAAMDELYKNLTTVVSGAAALAAVLLTAAVTKNAQIYDYLIISGVLVAFPYIPIHVLRAASLVDAATKDLDQFQNDLEVSAQELSFPFQVLSARASAEPSRTQLRRRVMTTALWLGIIAAIGVVTALVAYWFGQSSVKKLVPPWAVFPLIVGAAAVPAWMLIAFVKKHAGPPR